MPGKLYLGPKHKREPAEDAKKQEAEEIKNALIFIQPFKTCLPLRVKHVQKESI